MNTLDAQTALKAIGIDPGPLDGIPGPKTSIAVSRFQAVSGLEPTGYLNARTLAALSAAARKPSLRQGRAQYEVNEIVLHCSATRPNWYAGRSLTDKIREIRYWHTHDRGWRDIGYHWLIDRDGSVLPGRAETDIGAHVKERNRGTLGVCLIGGHGASENDSFEEHFTPQQDAAARRLIAEIKRRAQIRLITGHNQYAPKACPGFEVGLWLKARG